VLDHGLPLSITVNGCCTSGDANIPGVEGVELQTVGEAQKDGAGGGEREVGVGVPSASTTGEGVELASVEVEDVRKQLAERPPQQRAFGPLGRRVQQHNSPSNFHQTMRREERGAGCESGSCRG